MSLYLSSVTARVEALVRHVCHVFISIQGLVLVSKPYYNEAGYEKHVGTWEGEANSRLYNESAFLLTAQSMLRLLHRTPPPFGPLVKAHYKKVAPRLLHACQVYLTGTTPVGSQLPRGDCNAVSMDTESIVSSAVPSDTMPDTSTESPAPTEGANAAELESTIVTSLVDLEVDMSPSGAQVPQAEEPEASCYTMTEAVADASTPEISGNEVKCPDGPEIVEHDSSVPLAPQDGAACRKVKGVAPSQGFRLALQGLMPRIERALTAL
eukprot:jgi/Botrbrau1/5199/Bobra.0172s0067.1